MSNNLLRKIARDKIKNWAYDEYAKKQTAKARALRIRECIEKTRSDWKRECDLVVPAWAKVLSLYLPPKWCVAMFGHIVRSLPPQKLLNWFKASKTPLWAIKTIVYPLYWTRVVFDFTVLRPSIFIRRTVRTLGVTTKYFQIDDAHVQMVIRYWGRRIYSCTYKI